MGRLRAILGRCFHFYAFSILVFALVLLPVQGDPSFAAPQQTTSSNAPTTQPRAAAATHGLYCALWRVDTGFTSTIEVKNELVVAPITVYPVLYMADGTAYALPAVQLPTHGNGEININEALADAPEPVLEHLSDYGSVALRYSYPAPNVVGAEMHLLNVSESLVYVFPFAPDPLQIDQAGEHTFEGLWWKHDPGVGGFVSLANTTDQKAEGTFQVVGSEGTALPMQSVALQPHSTQLLDLDSALEGLPEAERGAGGIRIQFTGGAADIVVAGGLVNANEGYSAGIPFLTHQEGSTTPAQLTLASTGIPVGLNTMGTGFPQGLRFTPYAVLRNATSSPMAVSPVLYYTAGGAPRAVTLAPLQLEPGRALQFPLDQTLASLGLGNYSGAITLQLSYTGVEGDLVVATGSVDQKATYVFEVPPDAVAPSLARMAPTWTVAGGSDTALNLWNPEAAPQDLLVTFSYFTSATDERRYELPIHLGAKAALTIDVAQVIAAQKPDAQGRVIPGYIQMGSALVSNPAGEHEPLNIVVNEIVFNAANATCTCCCLICAGVVSLSVTANPFTVPNGSATQLTATATYNSGSKTDVTSGASWSSNNTPIATVTSGLVSGVSPGSVTITATIHATIGGACRQLGQQCPSSNFGGGSGGCVGTTITSISPAQGPVGASTAVTISGCGFGTSPTVDAGSGITVSIGSASDTQIAATFQVATTASAGNHTVKVTASGHTSNGVNFFVQIPARLVFFDTSCAPSGQGPLQIITNGSVVDCGGATRATNFCGVNRNLTYQLIDQNTPGAPFPLAYTISESFSNLSTTNPALGLPTPTLNQPIGANGIVTDAQFVGFTYPTCLGPNDHHSYTQNFTVSVSGITYGLSTTVSISKGNFNGTAQDNVSITVP